MDARKFAEEKDHSMRDKTMAMDEAVRRFVNDGDVIAFSSANYNRIAMAAAREIIRQRKAGLTVAKTLCSFEVELLLAANLVKKVISSWASIGVSWGVSAVMRDRVESGKVEYEEWSNLGINLRFKAGAMGVPFLPTFSMLGSDLPKQNGLKTVSCPYTNTKLAAVPALYPDVAVLHAQRADRYGNTIIDGTTAADPDIARAAKRVIVTVEDVVDTDDIRREADRTQIPSFLVDAVVHVPFGAHPYDCYGYYDLDYDHIDSYVNLVNSKGVESASEYLQEFVYGTKNHAEYLKKISLETIVEKIVMGRGIKHGWE